MTILSALIGGLLFWLARNDIAEWGIKSGFWRATTILAFSGAIYLQAESWWQFGLAVGLFVFVFTASHNLLLKPAHIQLVNEPRDWIQAVVFRAFNKKVSDYLGWPACVVYSVLRYAIPISSIGLVIDNAAVLISGPVSAIIMLPWVDGDKWKVHRSTVLGIILGGAMGYPL